MDSLRPGDPERIGRYVLYRLLGVGGMGEVFLGRSPGGKAVAVKLISPLFASDPDFRRRFRLEVEAVRKVGGFHAVQVVDADPDAERPWMVTTYVAGPSLKQVLARHRALPTETVRVLGAGLAEALEAIHREVIHRDLKPSNILLSYDGPHVIDFGIASAIDASAASTQPGTPGFTAPEIVKGEPATRACDVFALGVVLAAAAGSSPFGEGGRDEITYRIVHAEPDLDGLDPRIRGLIAECLVKDPAKRPTPAQIVERLGNRDPGSGWLPAAVLDMIPGYAPPQPTEVVRPVPQDDSRLLNAEQAARRVPDPYARAEAQVYVARAVSRFDPAHALRLVDDTLRPTTQRDGTPLSRQQMLRHLTARAGFELGTVLARANSSSAGPAGRMLDEIEGVIRAMIRDEPAAVGSVVTRLAEAVASTDPARADRIARMAPSLGVRASAVARAAMVVAGNDPVQADQMARAITRLTTQVTQPSAQLARRARPWWRPRRRETRHQVPAVPTEPRDSTRLWAVRALAVVAAAMAASDQLQAWSPATTEYESTITSDGDPGAPTPTSARTMARPDQLLADARQIVRDIKADDTQALALTAVTIAAAQVDSVRAGSLLAEAEQIARTSSSSSAREEALGEVALAAARTQPELAEQIARSLKNREQTVAEVASAVAVIDRARAERIAAGIEDGYVHALVMADIAIRTDPVHAGPRLTEALQAAHHDPALIVKVALAAARTDLARAEEMVGNIRSRDNSKTADFWRARALADLVYISDETRPRSN